MKMTFDELFTQNANGTYSPKHITKIGNGGTIYPSVSIGNMTIEMDTKTVELKDCKNSTFDVTITDDVYQITDIN